jgi:hypothetical protein
MKFPPRQSRPEALLSSRCEGHGPSNPITIFALIVLVIGFFPYRRAEAQLSSQFFLTLGEEYNDNIFFEKRPREHDFITQITPTFRLQFRPTSAPAHSLEFDFSPAGEIYARNSDLSNFGDNLTFNGIYAYDYSPRLSFRFTDSLWRQGVTRSDVGRERRGQRQFFTPTQPAPPGLSTSQTLGDFVSDGETLTNNFRVHASYLYAPDITLNAEYGTGYTSFLDTGGTELSNRGGIRGIYNWRQEHNLHVGYFVEVIKDRDGEQNVVHNFDLGDDYFSNTKIELTPTLTLALSTGVSFNASNDGPGVANNSNLTLTKLWERAAFTIGARKGLTGSHGVAGLSDTTSFFANFNMRITERLSTNAGVDYSLYDTDEVNFNTTRVNAGIQYAITRWLCSSLSYNHRRTYSDSGSQNSDLIARGNVYSNAVFVGVTGSFDLWPAIGFAKSSSACSAALQLPGMTQPVLSR